MSQNPLDWPITFGTLAAIGLAWAAIRYREQISTWFKRTPARVTLALAAVVFSLVALAEREAFYILIALVSWCAAAGAWSAHWLRMAWRAVRDVFRAAFGRYELVGLVPFPGLIAYLVVYGAVLLLTRAQVFPSS